MNHLPGEDPLRLREPQASAGQDAWGSRRGAGMRTRGMRFWGGVSAAVHVAALLLGLIFGLPRPLKEPEEQAVAVEIVTATPDAQTAQGDRPAPVAAPADAPQ